MASYYGLRSQIYAIRRDASLDFVSTHLEQNNLKQKINILALKELKEAVAAAREGLSAIDFKKLNSKIAKTEDTIYQSGLKIEFIERGRTGIDPFQMNFEAKLEAALSFLEQPGLPIEKKWNKRRRELASSHSEFTSQERTYFDKKMEALEAKYLEKKLEAMQSPTPAPVASAASSEKPAAGGVLTPPVSIGPTSVAKTSDAKAATSLSKSKVDDKGPAAADDADSDYESPVEDEAPVPAKQAVIDYSLRHQGLKRAIEAFSKNLNVTLDSDELKSEHTFSIGGKASKKSIQERLFFQIYFIHKKDAPEKLTGDLNHGKNAFLQPGKATYLEKERAAKRVYLELLLEDLKVGTERRDGSLLNFVMKELRNLTLDAKDLPEGMTDIFLGLNQKALEIQLRANPSFMFGTGSRANKPDDRLEAVIELEEALKAAWKI